MGLLVFGGACLQGVGGLGFSMFCAPIALLLFPELVPGPLLALGCPLALLAGLREFKAIEWGTAGYTLVGRALGAALATAVLQVLSGPTLSVVFALLILGGVALSVQGWVVRVTPAASSAAGVASGLMGTITSAGAPPLAIALQDLQPAPLRATLGCVFFIGSVMSLLALAAAGKTDAHNLLIGVLLLPWMAAGFFASGPLARRMSRTGVRRVLLTLATFSALAVLAQGLLHSQA
ncbi:TSUP family transporter [Ramlibacter sp. G-1-2-2]|uniref:Probable membrane transporter protein n=2 Tax=Ramlibacter agri TaxID=2728837 RepID=A0A848H2T6_9BURK|nr:sulfite exporter TauE/SafE family protein [Ramlibacter agri]NML44787.1 TSUP family transporter [Ramlibacter agri]